MGDGRIVLKSLCDALIKIYGMSLIWIGSISLDSTFKKKKKKLLAVENV
jgi:hypothetical protein